MSKEKPFYLRTKFLAILVILVFVSSTLGVWLGAPEETEKEYNGFHFYATPQGWVSTINNKKYAFPYLPQDLENISVGGVNIYGEKVYMAYDPGVTNISTELSSNRLSAFLFERNIRPVQSCIKEKRCPATLPITSCEDAAAQVIFFRGGNETKVMYDGQCIILQGKNSKELYQLTEKVIFKLLGVV